MGKMHSINKLILEVRACGQFQTPHFFGVQKSHWNGAGNMTDVFRGALETTTLII
jgi:hypothetical protein